jgi:hypothetical protein
VLLETEATKGTHRDKIQTIRGETTMKFISHEQARKTAYDQIRATPFTKVHGTITRRARDILFNEACEAATGFTLPFEWATDESGENYGGLAEVTGPDWYKDQTGIDTWQDETAPAPFDESIDGRTSVFEREKATALREAKKEGFAVLCGIRDGVAHNIRDAVDPKCYCQLKKKNLGYKGVKITEYFDHFDEEWCPMTVATRKQFKEEYYRPWAADAEHISEFIKHLNDEQEYYETLKIKISEDDKLDHFLDQMWQQSGNLFDQAMMDGWTDKAEDDKTWANACKYFKSLMRKLETWELNHGGTARKAKFESAANAEEQRNAEEIRGYLETIAAGREADKELVQSMEAKLQAKDAQLAKVLDKLDQLSTAQAALTAKLAATSFGDGDKENDGGRGRGRTPKRDRSGAPRRPIDKSGWKTCPHCDRKVSPKNGHTPAQCDENPDNKAKAQATKGTPAKDPE